MKQYKWLVALVVGALFIGQVALADAPTYTENWDGRGTDSERCDYVGQEGRPATGWIHWVFSTKGDSTSASLVLGGTGSGTFAPGEPLNADVWHFYTPYFELDGLTATISLFGGDEGRGGGLVISDYCPGAFEDLDVTKTVDTSFTREYRWDIDKKVETENEHELNGYAKIWLYTDGSGDEKATWTVDVTYEGYEDSDFNVSGEITIENTGTLDAVITAVDDVLAGTAIDVACGVTFPYTLPVGETLTCSYSEDVDVKIAGKNVVTVTTERDAYLGTEPIVWGDPDEEINETVNIEDISGLFGTKSLGSVTAPDGDEFTYYKHFAYVDFDECGGYTYDNTATIVETGQDAEATLKVNVQCFVPKGEETAFAKAEDDGHCFIPDYSRWGWTNLIGPGLYSWPLWAGAGQCDTDNGTLVGSVDVEYDAMGVVTVTFNVTAPYGLVEEHVYAGTTKYAPQGRNRFTVAPGQYSNYGPFDGGDIWVIAHAVVSMGYEPDPTFGPAY